MTRSAPKTSLSQPKWCTSALPPSPRSSIFCRGPAHSAQRQSCQTELLLPTRQSSSLPLSSRIHGFGTDRIAQTRACNKSSAEIFFVIDPTSPEIYTLSSHEALPVFEV